MAKRQGSLTETRFNLDQLQFTQAEKIQALRNELSTVEQRIAEVNGKQAYIVRAPIAGRISLLQASVGQPADPQRLAMEIVPSGSPLEAELFIPTRAIGFVEVGQKVRILYDAFPYQRFGTYRRQDHQGLADGAHEGGHCRTHRAEGTCLHGHRRARPAGCGCSRQEGAAAA